MADLKGANSCLRNQKLELKNLEYEDSKIIQKSVEKKLKKYSFYTFFKKYVSIAQLVRAQDSYP